MYFSRGPRGGWAPRGGVAVDEVQAPRPLRIANRRLRTASLAVGAKFRAVDQWGDSLLADREPVTELQLRVGPGSASISSVSTKISLIRLLGLRSAGSHALGSRRFQA